MISANYNDKFCVVIPTYNEEATIKKLVEAACRCVEYVYVIDDGSDETARIASLNGAEVIRGNGNGLASAICLGLSHADFIGHQYCIVMDAGGTHDATRIPELMLAMIKYKVDIVVTSRFLEHEFTLSDYNFRTAISLIAAWLVRHGLGINVTDATSSFRCYKLSAVKKAVRRCKAKGFAIQFELLAQAVADESTIHEVPVEYSKRTNSTFSIKIFCESIRVFGQLWLEKRRRSNDKNTR